MSIIKRLKYIYKYFYLHKKAKHMIIMNLRRFKFNLLSDNKPIGKPKIDQPLLCMGKGKIIFGDNVSFGVFNSPMFFSGYGYINAKKDTSIIEIGSNTKINNCSTILSEGEGIQIGRKCLIGYNFDVCDSDGHHLDLDKRISGTPKTQKIIIGNNCFIGSNVTILKGVVIGNNVVIAKGSIVTKSFSDNCIIAGIPAVKIRDLFYE